MRAWQRLAVHAVLAGCNPSTTSVRIDITAPPALAIDSLAITVDDDHHDIAMADSVRLLVPDSWSGMTRHIDVVGSAQGASVASAAVDVTPVAGHEVAVAVTLVGGACHDACTMFDLDVIKAGDASGTVSSSPAGISCGGICSTSYPAGTMVTLTASPLGNATFSGWTGGGCAGTGTCIVTMTAAQQVTATFDAPCTETCKVEVLASGQYANQIVLDDTTAYWTGHFQVMKRAKAGGAPQLVTSDTDDTWGIAVDDTYVYWSSGISHEVGWGIWRTPKASSGQVDDLELDERDAETIAVDATHVYWANRVDDRAVARTLKTGHAREVLTTSHDPAAVALDASYVYWVDHATGQIQRIPKAGGTTQLVASGPPGAIAIAVDSGYVYWTNDVDGQVRRAPKSGGAIDTLATGQTGAHGIAVDGSYLYWAAPGLQQVNAVVKTGGSVHTLASSQTGATGIAVDAMHVYWTSVGNGQVARISRCGCGL